MVRTDEFNNLKLKATDQAAVFEESGVRTFCSDTFKRTEIGKMTH